MRAHLVGGALEEAGIPIFVDEDNLADEFAISQKVMGIMRVRVLVPEDRLTEAQTILLGMSQPIPRIEDDEDIEAERERGRKAARTIMILAWGLPIAAILALAWHRYFRDLVS